MALTDSFLSNAGWLFFAAWSGMVAAVSIAAFGRELLPWKTPSKSVPADQVRATKSSAV
jgi:hypothetical protein